MARMVTNVAVLLLVIYYARRKIIGVANGIGVAAIIQLATRPLKD